MNHIYNVYYFIDKFDSNEILNLNKKIIIIYRNYNNNNVENDIKKIKRLCKFHNRKVFISNNLKIALKYNLNGLYIPSFNKDLRFKNISLKNEFKIIGSAHNIKEIKTKEKQGCSSIFISPLFKNNKNKPYLETIRFNLLCQNTNAKPIALGGINATNINRLFCTKAYGYAGISGIKKTGL